MRSRPGRLFYLMSKRLLDFSVSASGLMLLAPVMLVIGLIIKVSSPGPVFFRQKRTGHRGRIFDVVKFRTMGTDAEKVVVQLAEYRERKEPFVKLKKDPRVYPFGNILRKTSLDELPQLINVMVGQMSLVGPRPLLPVEMEAASEKQRERRLATKPGLTGWAQINGRTDVTFEGLMSMDLEYLERQSLRFDSEILLKTVVVVMKRRGAY